MFLLQFRHECQNLGCTNLSCNLCKLCQRRRCEGNFAAKYLAPCDVVEAKCGAQIYVVVVDALTGLLVQQGLDDACLQIGLIDGRKYEQEGANDEVIDSCLLLLNKQGQPLLAHGRSGTYTDDKRIIIPMIHGQAVLPDLKITDSSEALLTGRAPPFRLVVRAVRRSGEPLAGFRCAVSEPFVATARVKGAAKVEIPHLEDHVSKIECVGVQTQKKLEDIRAASVAANVPDLQLPINCVTKVGQFRELVEMAERSKPLRETLKQVLRLTKGWDVARDHVRRAVDTDLQLRCYCPDERAGVGLVFKCGAFNVIDINHPIGLLRRKPNPAQANQELVDVVWLGRDINQCPEAVRRMLPQASSAWWQDGHPGWGFLPLNTSHIPPANEAGQPNPNVSAFSFTVRTGPPPAAAGTAAAVPPLLAAPAAAPAAAFPLAAAGAAAGAPAAVLPAFGGLPTLTAPTAAVTTGWQGPAAVAAQQPNAAQQALNAHLGLAGDLAGLGGAGGLGPSGLLGGLGPAQQLRLGGQGGKPDGPGTSAAAAPASAAAGAAVGGPLGSAPFAAPLGQAPLPSGLPGLPCLPDFPSIDLFSAASRGTDSLDQAATPSLPKADSESPFEDPAFQSLMAMMVANNPQPAAGAGGGGGGQGGKDGKPKRKAETSLDNWVAMHKSLEMDLSLPPNLAQLSSLFTSLLAGNEMTTERLRGMLPPQPSQPQQQQPQQQQQQVPQPAAADAAAEPAGAAVPPAQPPLPVGEVKQDPEGLIAGAPAGPMAALPQALAQQPQQAQQVQQQGDAGAAAAGQAAPVAPQPPPTTAADALANVSLSEVQTLFAAALRQEIPYSQLEDFLRQHHLLPPEEQGQQQGQQGAGGRQDGSGAAGAAGAKGGAAEEANGAVDMQSIELEVSGRN